MTSKQRFFEQYFLNDLFIKKLYFSCQNSWWPYFLSYHRWNVLCLEIQ